MLNFYFMVIMDIFWTFLSSEICKVYFCLSAICWALKLLDVMRPLYKFHYTPDTSLQLLNTISGKQANKRKGKWENWFVDNDWTWVWSYMSITLQKICQSCYKYLSKFSQLIIKVHTYMCQRYYTYSSHLPNRNQLMFNQDSMHVKVLTIELEWLYLLTTPTIVA